jgi:chaperonin GroEL (HSP60 family)
VLARELIKFGLLNVTAGANPIAIKKGIDKTTAALVEELKRQARPVKGRDDIKGRIMVMAFLLLFIDVSLFLDDLQQAL